MLEYFKSLKIISFLRKKIQGVTPLIGEKHITKVADYKEAQIFLISKLEG